MGNLKQVAFFLERDIFQRSALNFKGVSQSVMSSVSSVSYCVVLKASVSGDMLG